jgi:hypothetical protein
MRGEDNKIGALTKFFLCTYLHFLGKKSPSFLLISYI